MELKKYVEEVVSIARENDMSWDIGLDMFIANIQNCEDAALPHYKGADEVDYKALKAEWDKLSSVDKADAKNEFCTWYRANKLSK